MPAPAPLAAPKPLKAPVAPLAPLTAPQPVTSVTPLTPPTPPTPLTPLSPSSYEGQYPTPQPEPVEPTKFRTVVLSEDVADARGQSISMISSGGETALYQGRSPRDACGVTGSVFSANGQSRSVQRVISCTSRSRHLEK